MRKARITAHQIIAVIRSVESRRTVKDACREAGISEATRDNWMSGYGGMDTRGITKGSTVFTVCSS
ncbi:transposase [Salmonella enterica subsp. enterica serovar Paratyphi B str. SARA62]|uniref:transposase n=1 Tax=Salmonella enterica TaxID=28901 RepID=UPI0003BB7479|nr:transposase [Salmonella enterica subsp. enterica serovar Paratyphi B str. SARA62]ESF87693.1 putative transposase [Salmonella enterica subsp. enterica serovar Paratyphi B str. ATCC BAA-1585]